LYLCSQNCVNDLVQTAVAYVKASGEPCSFTPNCDGNFMTCPVCLELLICDQQTPRLQFAGGQSIYFCRFPCLERSTSCDHMLKALVSSNPNDDKFCPSVMDYPLPCEECLSRQEEQIGRVTVAAGSESMMERLRLDEDSERLAHEQHKSRAFAPSGVRGTRSRPRVHNQDVNPPRGPGIIVD